MNIFLCSSGHTNNYFLHILLVVVENALIYIHWKMEASACFYSLHDASKRDIECFNWSSRCSANLQDKVLL